MKMALITGASQGIGSAIAQELNQKKIKVNLVSRSKAKLKKIQTRIKFPKNSIIISKDLRSLSACNSVGVKIKKLKNHFHINLTLFLFTFTFSTF